MRGPAIRIAGYFTASSLWMGHGRPALQNRHFRRLDGDRHRFDHPAVLPARHQATTIVFAFTNSRIPWGPSSRPYPEALTPPKGSRGSDCTRRFTDTMPAP